MPALHIRDVPDQTVAALRERAKRHGTSMQAELRRILDEAASAPAPDLTLEPIRLVTVRTTGGSTWSREEIYDDTGR